MFKVKIEKPNIKFQILSELSAWNGFVCSLNLKKLWLLKSGGKLTNKESQILEKFSLALRYGPDEAYNKILFGHNREISALKKNSKYKEIFESIDSAVQILESRIKKIEKLYLPYSKKVEKKILINKKVISKAIVEIHKFLDLKEQSRDFEMLVLLPKIKEYEAWGMYNRLILLPPLKDSWDNVLRTLIHEYVHIAIFHNSKLRNKIQSAAKPYPEFFNKISKKIGLPKEVIAEELFVSSLVPEGELARLIFPKMKLWITSSKADILEKTRKQFAKIMKPYVVQRWRGRISVSDYIGCYLKELKNNYK